MAQDSALQSTTARAEAARHTIWAADDNAEVRLLLGRAFKRCFPPVSAELFADGSTVVERVKQGAALPKVLLLDFQMPGLDGLQTLAALKSEIALSGTVVVMFSAHIDPNTVSEACSSGVRLFVGKPVNGHEYMTLANLCAHCSDRPAGLDRFTSAWDVTSALELLTREQAPRLARRD